MMVMETEVNYDLEVTYCSKENTRRDWSAKPRVYLWPEGESVLENFQNRRSRPINEYRSILRQAFAQEGIDVSNLEYRWSQKAGCSCGCSPGFIIDGWSEKLSRKNMHIKIKESC